MKALWNVFVKKIYVLTKIYITYYIKVLYLNYNIMSQVSPFLWRSHVDVDDNFSFVKPSIQEAWEVVLSVLDAGKNQAAKVLTCSTPLQKDNFALSWDAVIVLDQILNGLKAVKIPKSK